VRARVCVRCSYGCAQGKHVVDDDDDDDDDEDVARAGNVRCLATGAHADAEAASPLERLAITLAAPSSIPSLSPGESKQKCVHDNCQS